MAAKERIGGINFVGALERPHDVIAVVLARHPLLIEVAQEPATNRVGMGPLAVGTLDNARPVVHAGLDNQRAGHVLSAEHDLVPVVRRVGKKRGDLLDEIGAKDEVVFENQQTLNAIEDRTFQDLSVGLHATIGPAAGNPAVGFGDGVAVDRREDLGPAERPRPVVERFVEGGQAVGPASQIDDDDPIEIAFQCVNRERFSHGRSPAVEWTIFGGHLDLVGDRGPKVDATAANLAAAVDVGRARLAAFVEDAIDLFGRTCRKTRLCPACQRGGMVRGVVPGDAKPCRARLDRREAIRGVMNLAAVTAHARQRRAACRARASADRTVVVVQAVVAWNGDDFAVHATFPLR